MIFDSMDAQTIKGKTVGTLEPFGELAMHNGAPAAVTRVFDDFLFTDGTYGGDLRWSWFSDNPSSFITQATGEVGRLGLMTLQARAALNAYSGVVLGSATPSIGSYGASFDAVFIVKLNGSQPDANHIVRCGITDDASYGNPPSAGIYFEKLGADNNWYGVCRTGGAETRTSAMAAITNGWICLRIRRVSATVIGFSTADTLAGLATATESTVSTNLPTGTAICAPYMYCRTAAAAAKSMTVDLFAMTVAGLAR